MTEARNEQLIEVCEYEQKQLDFIRSNSARAVNNLLKDVQKESVMLIKKFVAMASSVGWELSNVCSEIKGMSNDEYRRRKRLLRDSIDKVYGLTKENK